MTEFNLIAEIGGIAQLQCPVCFTRFIKVAYSSEYKKMENDILIFIECPNCRFLDFDKLEN